MPWAGALSCFHLKRIFRDKEFESPTTVKELMLQEGTVFGTNIVTEIEFP